MNNYEKYVTDVNNIFSILEKMKNSWTNNDNLNFIEEIYELKKAVIAGASILDKESRNDKNIEEME